MSLLKVKQISLASGSLLVGGGSGTGSALALGTLNQVLRVNAAGTALEYATLTAADIQYGAGTVADSLDTIATITDFTSTGTGIRDLTSTDLASAIDEVASKAVFVNRAKTADPTATDDVDAGYAIGDIWINGGKIFIAESVTADAAVWTRVDSGAVTNVFKFKGTLDASLAANLPSTPEVGDTYKIVVAGDFEGDTAALKIGDFIAWTGTDWDVIDNNDPVVTGTTDRITVSGSADLGFTVNIASTYAGQASITTLGTITTGTWEADVIGQAFGGTGISTETVAGDVGKVLTVGATGALEYAYVSALKDSAGANALAVTGTGASAKLVATNSTVAGDAAKTLTTKDYVDAAVAGTAVTYAEETFTVATTEISFDLAFTPNTGTVQVFFNGIRLTTAEWTLTGDVVELNTGALGYTTETGDVISIAYIH